MAITGRVLEQEHGGEPERGEPHEQGEAQEPGEAQEQGGGPGRTPHGAHADQSDAPAPPSGTQLVAGALAAVTTTGLMSYLGVAGTIIGAALSSVVTVIGGYVYSRSLRRTAKKVTTVVPVRRQRSRGVVGGSVPMEDGAGGATAVAELPTNEPATWWSQLREAVRRRGRGKVLGAIAAVFLILLAVVTVIEIAAGKPLTDVVRDQEGTGTSIGHVSPMGPERSEELPTTDAPAPETPTQEEGGVEQRPTGEGADPTQAPDEGADPTQAPDEGADPTQAPDEGADGTQAPENDSTPAPTDGTTPAEEPAPGDEVSPAAPAPPAAHDTDGAESGSATDGTGGR